jgi:hypothetical protein
MAASFSGEGCGVIESAPMRLRKPYGALWKARVCFVGNKSLQNNVGAVKRQWRPSRRAILNNLYWQFQEEDRAGKR